MAYSVELPSLLSPHPTDQYDNVLMEEAAQILEIETFIPLMLQKPQDGHNRLKRVIMIGDHHQVRVSRLNHTHQLLHPLLAAAPSH